MPQNAYKIVPNANIILRFHHDASNTEIHTCCLISSLRRHSQYFNILLDPDKFKEGKTIHEEIENRLESPADQPPETLPCVSVPILGQLGKAIPLKDAISLFIRILHHVSTPQQLKRCDDLPLLTAVCILGDAYDALPFLKQRMVEFRIMGALTKEHGVRKMQCSTSFARQALLVGILLEHSGLVFKSSAILIDDYPSINQEDIEEGPEDQALDPEGVVMWRMIPAGIEEELSCRWRRTLETLESITMYFVTQYLTKQIQCKRGYTNSRECDAFQLGQAISFLNKKGILQIIPSQTYYQPNDEPALSNFILALRTCPPYQIDEHHSHCGLRERMKPILDQIHLHSQIGICITCWRRDRKESSWEVGKDSEKGERWSIRGGIPLHGETCSNHRLLKSLFTAQERIWTVGQ